MVDALAAGTKCDNWKYFVGATPLATYCKSCTERTLHAEVAKLVYALALGASGATHGGSSPLLGTR